MCRGLQIYQMAYQKALINYLKNIHLKCCQSLFACATNRNLGVSEPYQPEAEAGCDSEQYWGCFAPSKLGKSTKKVQVGVLEL